MVLMVSLLPDRHRDGRNGTQNRLAGDSSRKKRKRQNFMTERNSDSLLNTPSEIWEDVGGPNVSSHCHTNQAFAAAVKTFMQGHLASLDMIGASVKNRRWNASGGSSVHMSKAGNGEAGLVFGFGCGDVTLLELFLHSHKQREQLQASFEFLALCSKDLLYHSPTLCLKEHFLWIGTLRVYFTLFILPFAHPILRSSLLLCRLLQHCAGLMKEPL